MIGFQMKRTLKAGFKSLWLHKLRSGLTVLGIMFGVCSVIAMLAIGTGASEEAQEQIRLLGSNNIIVQSVQPPASQSAGTETTMINQYGLTRQDMEAILGIPGVEVVLPARRIHNSVTRGSHKIDTDIVGTVPQYQDVKNLNVTRGRFLSDLDLERKRAVCVLGRRAAEVLFPLGDAMDSFVLRGEVRFKVVGVCTSVSTGEAGGQEVQSDPNAEVYVPLTSMDLLFGSRTSQRSSGSFSFEEVELHELTVQVAGLEDVRRVERVIGHTLETMHENEDYQMIVPLALLIQARRTKRIFSIVLGSIAAISLLVGGIGIMNITLATVMERTREIGIRRAMGAKRKHIVFQFLTETLMLAMFGGSFGVALGIIAPYMVERFAGMKTVVTFWSLLLAFGISAAVGILFGIYPAYRAANMDPIEALRHE
jgi:putative ABC transport system permease protein